MSDFRLKVFQSVAKNLSFTKASQELFVSQPAITKHIQELESTYQARLFDRQGSKISLTEAGKLLLEHCGRILEDFPDCSTFSFICASSSSDTLITILSHYKHFF